MPNPKAPKPYVAPARAPKPPEKVFPRVVRPEANPNYRAGAADKPARPYKPAALVDAKGKGPVTGAVGAAAAVRSGPNTHAGRRGMERRPRAPLPPLEPATAKGMVTAGTPSAAAVRIGPTSAVAPPPAEPTPPPAPAPTARAGARVQVSAIAPAVPASAEPPNHVPPHFRWPPPNRGVTREVVDLPTMAAAPRLPASARRQLSQMAQSVTPPATADDKTTK
jgi:hypothetical protein